MTARLLFLLLLLLASSLPAQTRAGKDYAVFFYVTDFQPGIDDIRYTKTEAEALAKELSDHYGFECVFVPECKKDDIANALDAWNKKLGPADQALFFFSMHGYYDPAGDRGYLIPADGKADAEHNYFRSWFSYDDLRTYLAPCRAGHILVALDACYSGSFGIRSTKTKPTQAATTQAPDCAERIRRVMQNRGRQFITSGKTDQETPKQSAFAGEILKNLRTGYDAEGLIFIDDLTYRLQKLKSPEPEQGSFVGHAEGGDFVFVRKNACAPEPDRDGDGVPDARDRCPDNWGSGPDGCSPEQPPTHDLAADLEAWRTAKALHTEAAYREYLRRFSSGEFKDLANAALRQLEQEALIRRDDTAWAVAQEKNTAEGYRKYLSDYPNGRHKTDAETGIKNIEKKNATPPVPDDGLVFVPGGTFTMGCSSEQQDCYDSEKPAHKVTVSDFYIGRYEVTQKLWTDVMGNNPSSFKNCDNCPVEQVSWEDVQEFLKKLNQKYPGRNYRLPTEAEWEYAARGGGKAVLFGNGKNTADPKEINFDGDWNPTTYSIKGLDRGKTVPVGSLNSPNALGLHDMSGNVWEWCSDWYGSDYYQNSPAKDPTGPSSGSSRVLRGGSWGGAPQGCRVADRGNGAPGLRGLFTGFRLARTR